MSQLPVISSNLHIHDVLCGRGNDVQYYVGNMKFRAIIDKHKNEYSSCPRALKYSIRESIYDDIKSSDGKFLKWEKDTKEWSELSKKGALEKIGQALRDAIKKVSYTS